MSCGRRSPSGRSSRSTPTTTRRRPADTYEENARGKARYGRALAPADVWVIGEDAGIEVEALGWGPGAALGTLVGPPARGRRSRADRRAGALPLHDGRRSRPDGREVVADGTLDGSIADGARGDEGFGYDPVFVPDGEARTVAELGDEWKSRNSARARAAAALRAALAQA